MGRRVVIVGAGLAGLTCARELALRGIASIVVEADGVVGGRVRTDVVEGFPLDRGFQVLLTAYPETVRWLDYEALDLQTFYAGALTYCDGGLHRIADPWRHPVDAVASLHGPVGSLLDKARIAWLRIRLTRRAPEDLLALPESTTAERLQALGFSDSIIRTFLRPFFAAVFLDHDLATTSRMFDFTFRMFSTGRVAVPAAGMGAIPAQLAASLPSGSVVTGTEVASVSPAGVVTRSGETIRGDAVVVATGAVAAASLLEREAPARGRSVRCVYFVADQAPTDPYTLVLNGEGGGAVNNVCVRPGLPGTEGALVSATLLEPFPHERDASAETAREQLICWIGEGVRSWRHLRAYDGFDALPDQCVGALDPAHEQPRVRAGLYLCGDHCNAGSINGAMASGRRAAEALVAELAAAG